MYFEGFYEDYSFQKNKKLITNKDNIPFTEKWNYQVFHLFETLAKQSLYGGIIPSG